MALVTARWYATLADLKAELGETTTANDARLSRYIAQASADFEGATGRVFYPVTATKQWDVPRDACQLFLQYEDLLTLTTLSDDTGTIASDYYWLYPLRHNPKHTVKLNTYDLGRSFQYNETPHNVIVTTGTWGYCDNYADTGLTLAANVSTTTATKITASSAGLEVGMMLLIGTEAMHVSAVSGNVATVQRGALGTTAATHTAADAVYRYTPPADVTMAVLAMAAHTNNTRTSSGIKTESIGEYSVTYGNTSQMPDCAADVVKKYQRIGV
ncbi:MAG: phage head-tail connector protein [Anaerolineae bacterium]|nr:phage head-tail connector protein [Anaerolineae bacterium]